MAFGNPGGGRASMGVLPMAVALVIAAILGAVFGFVWQGIGADTDEPEEQIVAVEPPAT